MAPISAMRDGLVGRDTRDVTMGGKTRDASRERWGRPERSRVPGATGPARAARDRARSRERRAGAAARGTRFGLPNLGSDHGTGHQGGQPHPMLRLLHTADVHLGARHADLGEAAAAQRERQFAAFRAAVDLAIAEKVDLFLIAGDLFDSTFQPKRSVERVAAELARLAQARIRSVLVPGTHDVYDRSSVYRAYDMAAMAGTRPAEEMVTVLTPDHPWVHLSAIDAVVHGPCFPTKRAPRSPLHDLAAVETPDATWRIGVLHTSVAIPGRTDHDDVVVTVEEIAASGLDYLALGHWHSAQVAKTKGVTYAYAGAPEPVAVDQDKAGKVLLVTLDVDKNGQHTVEVDQRVVGRTTFERREI